MFNIYEFRKAHEMYQADFANIVGLTQSAISRMEKEGIDLSKSQLEKLYEKFGHEDVDAFRSDSSMNVSGNVVSGNGTQNNNMILADKEMLEIIRKQNETICRQIEVHNEMTTKLAAQNERLISILEKLSFD